jgi:hypothetical protein
MVNPMILVETLKEMEKELKKANKELAGIEKLVVEMRDRSRNKDGESFEVLQVLEEYSYKINNILGKE